MLVQNRSQIFLSEQSVWSNSNGATRRTVMKQAQLCENLLNVEEIVLEENATTFLSFGGATNIILLILYGEIKAHPFRKVVQSHEVLNFKISENKTFKIENVRQDAPANFLVFTFRSGPEHAHYLLENIHIGGKNNYFGMTQHLPYPNFIGIFDSRKEGFYQLSNTENSIFGMVLNGAFEFQNRLLHNRDALVISDIELLEFESLSQDSLIIFFEI